MCYADEVIFTELYFSKSIMEEIAKDSRFSHILKDAKFKKLPKKKVKVKIDKRFQSMFTEKNFQLKYKVDKRGRSANLGNSEDLKRYYDLSESDDSDIEVENKFNESLDDQSLEVVTTSEKDKKTLTPEVKKKLKDLAIDYARGEGAIFSDSSSDEEDSDLEDSLELEHDWGQLDKDAEHTDEATNRLAVCNMNWDRIEAADLMVLFHSFLPPGGLIHSVTIYPSEFGLQRMKEEEEKGPTELTETLPEGEDEEMNAIQMEKLRKYQLNRLKYYYAVVVCDTAETADSLYKECDGLEYESSSSRLDLRFIPNDTTFDQEAREACVSLPDLSAYKPKLFTTSALTKAKVDLTWDETDPNREEIVKSIHGGNLDESKLKKYLACSSSSDDESEDEDESEEKSRVDTKSDLGDIDKYKALLAEIEDGEREKKKKEVNLEVTWNLKLENKASEVVKEAAREREKKTPFEQFLEKRKEKKNKKKLERKAKLQETNQGSGDSAFSDDDIPSDVDLNDPYFKEELGSSRSKNKKKKPKEEECEESQQKKAELELLMLDNKPESNHFSLKKIEESEKRGDKKKSGKRKKRKAEEMNDFSDDFKIDVNDERFSALYTSHHFNIDPADPQFKPTKAIRELIGEKLRRRQVESDNMSFKEKTSETQRSRNENKNAELSVMVKNIKKNTTEVRKKARH